MERNRWHFGDRWYLVTAMSSVGERDGIAVELDDVAPGAARGLILEAFLSGDTSEFTLTTIGSGGSLPVPLERASRG